MGVDGDKKAINGKKNKINGLTKIILQNLSNITVVIRCKVVTRTLDIWKCKNTIVKIENDSMIATVQADQCQTLHIDFHDAPSGKNVHSLPGLNTRFWGEDRNDRVYHAGVSDLCVTLYRDGYIVMQEFS